MSYPQDVLEELVKIELRKAKGDRKRLQQKGIISREPARRHLAKVNFYLAVYDRAMTREPFDQIARAMKKSKSTVHYAFVQAKLWVGNNTSLLADRRRRINKSTYDKIQDLDIGKHLAKCPTCKNNTSANGGWHSYCPMLQDWATYNEWPEWEDFRNLPDE